MNNMIELNTLEVQEVNGGIWFIAARVAISWASASLYNKAY
jgi:hypothetical protein